MLQKIIIQCKYEGDQRASYNWGSLFHGFLMRVLPAETAALLHESVLRPFSQYVRPLGTQQLAWNIGLWDADIAECIVQAVMPLSRIELEQKGIILEVCGVQRITLTETEYFNRFFMCQNPCRRYEIEFLTPCTHKQNGNYALFPSLELIVGSLSRRYSAFVQDISLDDSNVMQEAANHMRIVRYSLRSAVYYLDNTKITGYTGKITLVLNGPEQLARLSGALLSFAEYSGLGIKTALGMGGVRVNQVS
ncbi:CRISPR system precrRNA processing endoribonuclease RAMP protein Cas6 [Syntrophomonas palmitatica]|uniref:CRISPR system precrRNA processing endoribonuclease RAMP protein Cas6 n=1 Tax=Syntrophomonas palmitatica TaxID=402877 RepID=UPI0006D26405|nr:CRISPR system precrRNA processing endoribonuclease RAMP protein Cas6 [Syntrophomonas palmitatica]